jgi:hypothetical protein
VVYNICTSFWPKKTTPMMMVRVSCVYWKFILFNLQMGTIHLTNFHIFKDFENTWINDFLNGCMQYTKQFILVFEEALNFIQKYWHVVRLCCFMCFHCNYYFVVKPHCLEFLHCLHKLTMFCLDYSYFVFLLWLAKCICPLCCDDLWNFWLIFIWFVVEILEIFKRIGVLYGASSSGFQ